MGLQMVELVMEAEDEFGITVDDLDDYGQTADTVGAFYDLLLRLIRASPTSPLARRSDLESHLWGCLTILAARHGQGLRPDQITRATRFVQDLGYG